MQTFDILIVGGGPAGSTLAYSLHGTGLRIGILDKQTFPRHKVCAGWVTPEVMRLLNIDLNDYASGRVLQPISGFRISQLGQQQVESHYPDKPVSYGIRRIEFDAYLLQRCGAELLLGEAFDEMQRNEHGWLVNGHISARLVVGAGGHFCPVARAIGAKGVSEVAVAAQEVEYEMTPEEQARCSIRAEVPELFFTPDLAGYGWVFRKGNYLNIGLGREDRHRLSGHVQRFVEFLTEQHKLPGSIAEKFNGHAYLLYPHAVRRLVDDQVLLIGDAAGLAYPQSGEGIRPAVESAILAGDVIRECAGDYSKAHLQAYNDLIVKRFGERQPAPRLLERLPRPVKQFFARRLLKTRWFNRRVVIDHWFLQARQRPLPAIHS